MQELFQNAAMKAADWIVAGIPQPVPDQVALGNCKIISHRGEHDNTSTIENTLTAFEIARTNGIMSSVFEVKVAKEVVLHGMNADLIRLEEEAYADNEVKGKDLRVGSLNEVSDKGNWPPTYDQADINKKK